MNIMIKLKNLSSGPELFICFVFLKVLSGLPTKKTGPLKQEPDYIPRTYKGTS